MKPLHEQIQSYKEQGREAFFDGKPVSACPYVETCFAGKFWKEGYYEAEDEATDYA